MYVNYKSLAGIVITVQLYHIDPYLSIFITFKPSCADSLSRVPCSLRLWVHLLLKERGNYMSNNLWLTDNYDSLFSYYYHHAAVLHRLSCHEGISSIVIKWRLYILNNLNQNILYSLVLWSSLVIFLLLM